MKRVGCRLTSCRRVCNAESCFRNTVQTTNLKICGLRGSLTSSKQGQICTCHLPYKANPCSSHGTVASAPKLPEGRHWVVLRDATASSSHGSHLSRVSRSSVVSACFAVARPSVVLCLFSSASRRFLLHVASQRHSFAFSLLSSFFTFLSISC